MPKQKKAVKLCITLPGELATELRQLAPRGKLSAFLTEALRRDLAWRRQEAGLEKGFGAWKTEDHPDLMTSEDSTAYVSALRDLDQERQDRLDKIRGK